MRHVLVVAAVIMFASATTAEANPAVTPCVVRIELGKGRVTLRGDGISGSDVTALRKVAKTCTAQLVADDDATFDDVVTTLGRVAEQGIVELRLGQQVGQWMSVDLERVGKLWSTEPAAALIAAVKHDGSRLGAENAPTVEQVASVIARARQDQPLGKQTADRGLFEAVAQIVGLRRATAPIAVDLLERIVMPALEIDTTAAVAHADGSKPQTGVEVFELFVARSSKHTAVKGLLGAIPDTDVSTPYSDGKPIELGNGDWQVVAAAPLAKRLASYDQRKLVAQYNRFVDRWKLRDDDRVLVDATTRALADLAGVVTTAGQNRDALVFRLLPAPKVEPWREGDPRTLPTVVITQSSISVVGAKGPVLSSLPRGPRTIVIEADRSLAYARIGALVAALGPPGEVTVVLRRR